MFVRTRECVCARNSESTSALARDCHLVGADLGPFRPVGFVVVCKTRVNVNSAFPLESPNESPLRELRDGNFQDLSCMSLLL